MFLHFIWVEKEAAGVCLAFQLFKFTPPPEVYEGLPELPHVSAKD